MNNKQWEEEFYQKFGHIQIIKDDKNGNSYDRITDFISDLLKEREAEIRKEYEFDTNKSLEDKIDNIINNPPTWTDGNPKSQLERIMGVFNAELSEIRKETILAVLPEIKEIFNKEQVGISPTYATASNINSGWNESRQSIIESAKFKFNITI